VHKAIDEKMSASLIVPALRIEPHSVYRGATIQAVLGIGARPLRAEWRTGRLRIVTRCNRNLVLGKDLLSWLDGGELQSPAKRHTLNGATAG
jgi:hypothetical protein